MAITPLPTPPSRQDPSTFSERADNFLGQLPTFATEANQLAVEVNTDKATVQQLKDDTEVFKNNAETSASVAQVSANFKGLWSNLTGGLNVPAAVKHNAKNWNLLNNLVNVTLSEPSEVNSDWEEIKSGGLRKVPLFSINSFAANEEILKIVDLHAAFDGQSNSGDINAVFNINGIFYSINNTGTTHKTSVDGYTWITRTPPAQFRVCDFDGTQLVGTAYINTNNVIAVTSNGLNYSTVTLHTNVTSTRDGIVATTSGKILLGCQVSGANAIIVLDNTDFTSYILTTEIGTSLSTITHSSIGANFLWYNGDNKVYHSPTGLDGSWVELFTVDTALHGPSETLSERGFSAKSGNNFVLFTYGSAIYKINADLTYDVIVPTIGNRLYCGLMGQAIIFTTNTRNSIYLHFKGKTIGLPITTTSGVPQGIDSYSIDLFQTHFRWRGDNIGNIYCSPWSINLSVGNISAVDITTGLNVIIGEV